MFNMKPTKSKFKKGDIVNMRAMYKSSSWYDETAFYIVVSHYLLCYVGDDKYEFLHESKLKSIDTNDLEIERRILNVKCLNTSKYTKVAEEFLELNKLKNRDKTIEKLLK